MSSYDNVDPSTGMSEREAGDAVFDELMMSVAAASKDVSTSTVENALLLALVGIANRLDKQCDLSEQAVKLMREQVDLTRKFTDALDR